MAKKTNLIPIAGIAALLFLLSGSKKASASPKSTPEFPTLTGDEPKPAVVDVVKDLTSETPEVGHFYKIKLDDTLLEICREALFGSRDLLTDPAKRNAVLELAIRVDCSPFNQTLYGRPREDLKPGHAAVEQGITQKGVSFNPIYKDNLSALMSGKQPSAGSSTEFAFIWIPGIDIERFDTEGIITLEGQNWPDTEQFGIGHSKIDPPPEVLALGFEGVVSGEVGCELPEGDYRKTLEPNG